MGDTDDTGDMGDTDDFFARPLLPPPPATGGRADTDVPLRSGRAPSGKRSGYGLASLIGDEDRTHVTDTDAVPWRSICSLVGLAGGEEILMGTGALISPRMILTAGHNFDPRVEEIEIAPALSGDHRPYGCRRVGRAAFRMHPAWEDLALRDPSRDAGVIVLDEPFRDLPETWFAVAAAPEAALAGWMLNIAGYPEAAPADGVELWFHANGVERIGPGTLGYAIDTTVGQSGAPVWIDPGGDAAPTIVGIHAYGAPPVLPPGFPPVERFNSATRIDDDLAAHIRRWMPQ